MIVPDANLVLYAYDASCRFHDQAVAWWERCLRGVEPVGVTAPMLFAFVRIGTSSRAFELPLAINEAAEHARSWLEEPVTVFLPTQEQDLLTALKWLEDAGTGGNLTTDAQIAAIAHRCRGTVHTADTDFYRFPGVRKVNPILER